MNFRCKFRHRLSTRRPRFPVREQNFGDLATFSVDYCILYSECPPYFYFRFLWPIDLESIPHASTPQVDNSHRLWSWYDYPLPSYSVFCLLIRHVTWWPWSLTFWPWTVDIHGGSRVQPCHHVWRPYSSVPILRFKVRSTDAWRARRARAYNGGLGQSPWSEGQGGFPLKLKAF